MLPEMSSCADVNNIAGYARKTKLKNGTFGKLLVLLTIITMLWKVRGRKGAVWLQRLMRQLLLPRLDIVPFGCLSAL